ncbi:MAG TPA: DNA mismatch repair endonuclease MutL [Verrucomicrobiae bacterium]|jgi:DNA mismatch repair protein MutL
MNRIRLLSEQVANQIAAGEVVERPASVVKELVENALDARATRIAVEIQAGGRSLIRVTDDGTGMSRDDALLCLERHATSKIQRAEDLSAITTMGFRGEALPSIASVSRMTLTTREREGDAAATQVIINGGKLLEVKAAGSPPGTSLEVRQLFFNLPARRKFLRTEETESAHIHHYLTLAALAHPEVAFTFTRDSRAVWQLPAVRSEGLSRVAALRERMRGLSGGEQEMLAVDFTAELGDLDDPDEATDPSSIVNRKSKIQIWGLIGTPGVSRSTREDQHVFVNRRPVENRGLNFALIEGYHTALMKGRYPVCCLFLEVDPATVDVNIHPSKREVKFHNERDLRRLTAEAVRQTLLQFHSAPAGPSPPAAPAAAAKLLPPPATPLAPSFPVTKEFHSFTALTGTPLTSRLVSPPVSPFPPRPVQPSAPATPPESQPACLVTAASHSPTPPLPHSPVSAGPTPLLHVPLRLVGVIGRLYVVLESDRGMVLMDQHAAHERILFEQMLNRLEQGGAPSQRLLLPETVELSVRDAQFLKEQLPTLTRLGVGLAEFGERTFLLDALPPFVKVGDARRFVLQLVDELKAAGAEVNSLRLGEHTIAKTVCRHAVKANDPLQGPELENLVNDLRHCAMPYTCPHGRPTLIEMNFRELEKKFGRVAG